ncbi:MAG: hypothetical protein ACYDAL_16350 [Candidatus Dormibacteraceae bacterium]
MIEIAIIVQIKDVGPHGSRGRMGVGFAKWQIETLIPQKKWAEFFFDALRRAMKNRQINLEDVRRLADEKRPLLEKIKQETF